MKQYQITLKCGNGQYKPVSCVITCEEINLNDREAKKALIKKGIEKICIKRYWTSKEIKKYGYTIAMTREYDKEKLAAAAQARYDAIKEARYQSGEWKRPKIKE